MPELRMLSEYYKARITVVYIGADELISFGPTGSQEIFLLFDGSHYNLAIQNDQRVFPEGQIGEQFRELVRQLKSSGDWIDPNLFSLKCADCGKAIEGQFEAIAHAQ